MFRYLGDLAYRRRRLVLAATALFFVVAAGFGGSVASILTAGTNNFEDPAAESIKARNLLAHATGVNPEVTVIALVTPGAASPDELRARVEQVARELRKEPEIKQVNTAYNAGVDALISKDGRSSYLLASTELL